MAVKPLLIKKNIFKESVEIIINLNNYSDAKSAVLSRLSEFVVKATQVFRITVSVVSDKDKWTTVFGTDKNISDALTKQKLVVTNAHEGSQSKSFLKSVNNSESTYFFPFSLEGKSDVEMACRFLNSLNKTDYSIADVLIGSGDVENPSKPVSAATKYFNGAADFWHRFFTGKEGKNSRFNLAVYPKELLTERLENMGNTNALTVSHLLTSIQHESTSYVPLDISSCKITFGEGFKSFFGSVVKAKSFTAYYFIKSPIASFKVKSGNEGTVFSNNNHKAYRLAFFIVAAFAFCSMLFMSKDFNVTWDEPNHNSYSNDVIDYYATLGEDTSVF
ncbi:MAG: hypothetical protein H7321_05120, partial [Bacteroidia bacterium]|nr:hypothetical protein [Bacteroidia bacterium]